MSGDDGRNNQVKRSHVGSELLKAYPKLYQQNLYKGFKDYTAAAAGQNIVELGGSGGDAWIQLNQKQKLTGRL